MGFLATPKARSARSLASGLYARVSTPHQHTIRMQLRQLREFLERRRWQKVLVVEEVVSGSRRRPERDRLLDAARRREIDIIAVWRLDRWGRSLSDLMLTLRELQELDVAFVSLTEAFDLTTSTGRAMAAMVAVFAEFEREIRRERVRAGIEQARHERNLPISGPAGSLRVIFHTVAAQTPWCPIKSAGVRISAMRVTLLPLLRTRISWGVRARGPGGARTEPSTGAIWVRPVAPQAEFQGECFRDIGLQPLCNHGAITRPRIPQDRRTALKDTATTASSEAI